MDFVFIPSIKAAESNRAPQPQNQRPEPAAIDVRRYAINTEVTPPKRFMRDARLQCECSEGGAGTLLFELSRFLQWTA